MHVKAFKINMFIHFYIIIDLFNKAYFKFQFNKQTEGYEYDY